MAKTAELPKATGTVHEDETAEGPGEGHNQIDELREGKLLRATIAKIDGLQRTNRSTTAKIKAVFKAAKAEGLDNEDIKWIMEVRDQTMEEVEERLMRRLRFLKHMDLKTRLQLHLNFAEDGKKPPTEEQLIEKAEEDGYLKGLEGRGAFKEENPHEKGTPQHEKWLDGWTRAQKELAEEMRPESKPDGDVEDKAA